MSIFDVRERLWSTLRTTSNGDRRTGSGFMKEEKKELNTLLIVTTFFQKNVFYLGVVMYL